MSNRLIYDIYRTSLSSSFKTVVSSSRAVFHIIKYENNDVSKSNKWSLFPWGQIRGEAQRREGSEFTLACLMDNLVRHTSFVPVMKGKPEPGVWEILGEADSTHVTVNTGLSPTGFTSCLMKLDLTAQHTAAPVARWEW